MIYETLNERHKDFVKNIKIYFKQKSNITVFKKRNTIKRIKFEGVEYIVKSFRIPHLLNQIVYSLIRDSKAKKSYFNSIKIEGFVPEPIGYIEFKKFGLLKDSFFISSIFKYDFTIREPLTDKYYSNKDTIYKAFANFTNKLHNKAILHLDYSPGNILIKENSNRYEFKIIDVNRMLFKKLTMEERLKNFSKLWASDEDLTIIIKEYAKINNINEIEALNIALKASKKHKNLKNLKKRLKGKKVVD